MALLRDNAGDVQPRLKRVIQVPGIVLAADVDLGSLVAGNFSIESGTAIPTHSLPGALTHGAYLRAGGISLNAVVYITIDSGTTWTGMTVP